jgi:hypothetical protein
MLSCVNMKSELYANRTGLHKRLQQVTVELYNVSKTPRCFGGTTATVYTVPTTANIDGV